MVKEHEDLIIGISEQMKEILDNSEQAIYIYLDDIHKVCNAKFASLLGYRSPEEWSMDTRDFPMTFVAEKSRNTLVNTYRRAVERMSASTVKITWVNKMGGAIDTTVILVPITYANHIFALHFIE
jgi:hypothetical protein